jgi:hypothetical protein
MTESMTSGVKHLIRVPDFILNHPDYYAFFTHTMFHGKVAK